MNALRNAVKVTARTTAIVETDLLAARTIVEAAVSRVEVKVATAGDRSERDGVPPEALRALLSNPHALALPSRRIVAQLNGLEVRAIATGCHGLDAAAGPSESHELDHWSWSGRAGGSFCQSRGRRTGHGGDLGGCACNRLILDLRRSRNSGGCACDGLVLCLGRS